MLRASALTVQTHHLALTMRQETNHEFFMDPYNVMFFKDTPHTNGGAILVDGEDGHVAVHGVEPEMIVRLFRNFVAAKHNSLFDIKDDYAKGCIKEIAEAIRAYYEIKGAPERRELFKPCKD